MSEQDPAVREILYRLSHQDEILVEIRAQVKATNGRVTELERWRAWADGARAAMSWRAPAITGVVCVVLGAGLARLLGG